MAAEALPDFQYHPDPRATGMVVESKAVCVACERSRGFIYNGPAYSVEEYDQAFCPWCIADGSAADRFDVEFTDVGWGVPDDAPPDVTEQIARRTPGFSSWQQDHWLYHCGDGAAFLGAAGYEELTAYPDAIDDLRRELADLDWGPEDADVYIAELDREGATTAYLFRCRHCARHLAYSDAE